MSEFDIFFGEYEDKHNCSPKKYECYEAGQQSKQAEIDKLQKRVDAVLNVLEKLDMLEDEKWHEWEGAAEMYAQGESSAYGHASRMLEQALKGGSNDH